MSLRLIHLGFGPWGRNWCSDIVKPARGVKLVACVDDNPENLRLLREESDIPKGRCYLSLSEALKATPADAVLITSGVNSHVPVARAALRAGKHVLVEKPFAPTVQAAQRLADLAEQKDRVLMVSQNYRFLPSIRGVERMLRRGELGNVGSVAIDFRRYVNNRSPGGRHYRMWHPLLVDMSIHHFDALRMLLGSEPRRVWCHPVTPPWSKFRHPGAAFGTVEFECGAVASYRGSWIAHEEQTGWLGQWLVECEHGAVHFAGRGEDERLLLYRGGAEAKAVRLPNVKYPDRAGTLHAFAKAVAEGEHPECSARDNIGTLRLMLAMVRAADSGKPVTLKTRQ